jgi:hypothetical protein
MSNDLAPFLRSRSERNFHVLLRSVQSVTAEQAGLFARADWPGHRWGIGQDGSISGIVYHVAAWKAMTMPMLSPGGQAISRQDFDFAAAPDPRDWPGLVAWLQQVGEDWLTRLAQLPDNTFDESREWESTRITVAQLITEIMEHDVQHASQIDYLQQRIAAEKFHAG